MKFKNTYRSVKNSCIIERLRRRWFKLTWITSVLEVEAVAAMKVVKMKEQMKWSLVANMNKSNWSQQTAIHQYINIVKWTQRFKLSILLLKQQCLKIKMHNLTMINQKEQALNLTRILLQIKLSMMAATSLKPKCQ